MIFIYNAPYIQREFQGATVCKITETVDSAKQNRHNKQYKDKESNSKQYKKTSVLQYKQY